MSKAAERFKNVAAELNEWETKHGKGFEDGFASRYDRSSVVLPQLGYAGGYDQVATSILLPRATIDSSALYKVLPLQSPPIQDSGTPTTNESSLVEEFSSPGGDICSPGMIDSELESKMRLLAEVKKARQEVQGSIERLRGSTPTTSQSTSGNMPRMGCNAATHNNRQEALRPEHTTIANEDSVNCPVKAQLGRDEWEVYTNERKIISSSTNLMDWPTPIPESMRRHSSSTLLSPPTPMSSECMGRTMSMVETRSVATNSYTDTEVRKIQSYRDCDSTFHDMPLSQPIILDTAAQARLPVPPSRPARRRTMTYEELAKRHRMQISKLQEPVNAKMKEGLEEAET